MTPAAFVDPARMGDMAKDSRVGVKGANTDRHRLPKRGVYVEKHLWESVKERATEDGRTLNGVIVELLRGYVGGKYRIERQGEQE